MYAYGDESGHLRNLLAGNCDVFVLAVVAGDQHDCGACPKRAVRRIRDLDEAKWSDLTVVQKRRVVDYFADRDRDLSYGYIALDRSDLRELDNSYLLHQDRAFERDWDLSVIGHGYAYILQNVIGDEEYVEFTFDRMFGRAQSDQIMDVIGHEKPNADIRHKISHSVQGIQAADCIAGLVGEEHRGGRGWVHELNDRIVDVSCGFTAYLNDELVVRE